MDFAQKVSDLASRSRNAARLAMTEEATKTSVVLPLLQALGYDVFNLEEVVPEFIADVGIKKGEKIDFAIKIGGKIAILIETKPISMSLGNAQFSQLYRYFSTAEARLAILTNGKEIWFFSDIDERNKMDKKPFFVFDLQNYDEKQVTELARFQKSNFNIEDILDAASNLKYVKAAASYFSAQLKQPDDDFVRLVGRQIYEGSITKSAMEVLRPAIQSALDEVIRNRIQEKLNVTFAKEATAFEQATEKTPTETVLSSDADVVTTDEERFAFMIVQAIGSKVASVERITMRDAKTYCSVFVDDNNRKPVCRFYFNGKNTKAIGVFSSDKEETKFPILNPTEIYSHSEMILSTIEHYVRGKS